MKRSADSHCAGVLADRQPLDISMSRKTVYGDAIHSKKAPIFTSNYAPVESIGDPLTTSFNALYGAPGRHDTLHAVAEPGERTLAGHTSYSHAASTLSKLR